jgi:hypothetical protein
MHRRGPIQLVVVQVGTDGNVSLVTSASTQVIFDVARWMTLAAAPSTKGHPVWELPVS